MQQCFLSYYNIFLPLKAKGSLQGMVTLSLQSHYQGLMITQIPVSFEYKWIFFPLKSLPYSCSCGNALLPFVPHLVSPNAFQKYITRVFFSPYEKILYYLQTWRYHLDIPSPTSLAKLLNESNQETNILVILLLTFHH